MDEDPISARLHERIQRDYPDADVRQVVVDALRSLAVVLESSLQDTERLLAAAVFDAAGDVDRLQQAPQLAQLDWRDLLVFGGLGDENRPQVMDEELGSRWLWLRRRQRKSGGPSQPGS